MSKIIGVTVGTPLSVSKIEEKLPFVKTVNGKKPDENGNVEAGSNNGAGNNGADGKSAYEIAVINGFDGTEEEWLASLKGEQGEQGEKGEKGDPGDTLTTPNTAEGIYIGSTYLSETDLGKLIELSAMPEAEEASF